MIKLFISKFLINAYPVYMIKSGSYHILICLFSVPIYSFSQLHCPYIIVDQFGYLPYAKKIAVIRDPQTGFDADESYAPGSIYSVLNTKGEKVFTGVPVAWGNGATHSGSGDKAWHFDFSALRDPGTYYILDEKKGQRSVDFIISSAVYNELLRQAMRTFFYQRAGFAREAQFAGIWIPMKPSGVSMCWQVIY